MTAPAIYLAGPEVFLPEAEAIGARKQEICAAHGLVGLYPLDAVNALGNLDHLDGPAQALAFFDACVGQLDESAATIANLTPFRGPSADVGTVWELGYAYGQGKPVFAYTNDTRHYGARIEPDGLMIESFDLADNLMLEGAAFRTGASIERHPSGLVGAPAIAVLDGFEACVVRAAELLVPGR